MRNCRTWVCALITTSIFESQTSTARRHSLTRTRLNDWDWRIPQSNGVIVFGIKVTAHILILVAQSHTSPASPRRTFNTINNSKQLQFSHVKHVWMLNVIGQSPCILDTTVAVTAACQTKYRITFDKEKCRANNKTQIDFDMRIARSYIWSSKLISVRHIARRCRHWHHSETQHTHILLSCVVVELSLPSSLLDNACIGKYLISYLSEIIHHARALCFCAPSAITCTVYTHGYYYMYYIKRRFMVRRVRKHVTSTATHLYIYGM